MWVAEKGKRVKNFKRVDYLLFTPIREREFAKCLGDAAWIKILFLGGQGVALKAAIRRLQLKPSFTSTTTSNVHIMRILAQQQHQDRRRLCCISSPCLLCTNHL
jgi:hypothetical protein